MDLCYDDSAVLPALMLMDTELAGLERNVVI